MLDLLLAIPYPAIDPVAIAIGPVAVRWYALAYVAGLVFAWWHVRRLGAEPIGGAALLESKDVDDLLFWATLGVVLGGRLGYVLFYKPGYYIDHLDEVLSLWKGGMSFHGGMLGVVAAIVWIAHSRRRRLLSIADLAACATPMGLFFGRLANFINGELWGRASDVPWAMVFPDPAAGPSPRHPSQLYQAALEGLLLFALLWLVRRRTGALARPGELSGWFGIGYGVARCIGEIFREPDAHLGFILGPITMGQLLSVPLILAGAFLVRRARRSARAA
jgi:phosphatidylglycerol:prolipoprotein diacylglycerol transferase